MNLLLATSTVDVAGNSNWFWGQIYAKKCQHVLKLDQIHEGIMKAKVAIHDKKKVAPCKL
jgi:hypothetical protein